MIENSFIVTGPARSGTHWVARVLHALNIDAWHEAAFRPATLSKWDQYGTAARPPIKVLQDSNRAVHDGEVSWLAAPYLHHLDLTVPVVHLVRDPLTAASSLEGRLFNASRKGFEAYRKCADAHMGCTLPLLQEIDYCLHYWWCWNHLVEPRAFLRVTLEDLTAGTDAWVELLERIGFPRTRKEIGVALELPLEKNAGNRPRRDLQWTDFTIPWLNEIQAMAERYGYA